MNQQGQQYMDFHNPHLSNVQQPTQTATSGGMNMYSSQPTLLQPAPGSYGSSQQNGYQYGYNNNVSSPHNVGHPVSSAMPHTVQSQMMHPTTAAGHGAVPQDNKYNGGGAAFDTTGQIPPPGMKPRVTATLWEDEGSLCFQVEARGICVARREDNHMINGTKLLNVAGMTRGRRDGILKSEKQRHVVKIGPMHLKGVWIPFERALEFANKEKITDLLYPLFVHHISSLLYHPTNSNRTNQVMQAAARRQGQDPNALRSQQQIGASPSVPPPMSNQAMVPASHSSNAQSVTRPTMDRAHTFPTPPTSATGSISISNQDNSYQWNQQAMMPSAQHHSTQPLSIDTGLSNTRSLPSTPATTPPGNNLSSNMQYSQMQQSYDRPMYSAPPQQQAQYAPHHDMNRYQPQPLPSQYIKNEMAPPTRSEAQIDEKNVLASQHPNEQIGHVDEEPEHEPVHDEYQHNTNGTYSHGRNYGYGVPTAMSNEHGQLSPEMTDSPNHQAASGRATPRGQQWVAQPGYNTPPPVHSAAGTMPSKGYVPSGGPDAYGQNMGMHYPQPLTNSSGSNKRRREDDDDGHDNGLPGIDGDEGLKRRKTINEGTPSVSVGMVPGGLNRSRSAIVRRR